MGSSKGSYSPKHPMPKKILFECGRSVEVANFDLTATEIQAFKLAKVAVDTANLSRPQIKLEFTTEIFAFSQSPVNNFSITLFFDIVQVCNGQEEILREFKFENRWSINPGDGQFNRIVIHEPYTITQCIHPDCSDCCQYYFQVRCIPADDLIGAEFVIVNENNLASISAFAQGLCDGC